MSGRYILVHGEPQVCEDLHTWALWFEQANYERIVAQNEIGDVSVSTVFLGLDHSFGGATPLLFETMIFNGPHDGYQERYATKAEALEGHAKALALVKP